ncbi:hypothetical protein LZ30DRAFT_699197 [Colletotrichum cereale]|nr:hypothetical protein LZ30DRAFT_699197 [Colletotrichum cereale]
MTIRGPSFWGFFPSAKPQPQTRIDTLHLGSPDCLTSYQPRGIMDKTRPYQTPPHQTSYRPLTLTDFGLQNDMARTTQRQAEHHML